MSHWPRSLSRLFSALVPGVISVMSAPHALSAQPSPYRIDTLAAGVYAVVRQVPPGNVSDSNVLIIINDRDVVVVDANVFPTSARQMIDEIRKRTDKPVRYVINTHEHLDHTFGNSEYRRAFPGVEFIQHPVARTNILTQGPAIIEDMMRGLPAEIESFKTALASGKRSTGEPLSPRQREAITRNLALNEFRQVEYRSISIPQMAGTLTVADSLVLYRGSRRIVVKHAGLGNTAGDLIVHLPEERIVATGDLVVAPWPYGFDSFLREWPATLRRVQATNALTIVPGHGAVMHDWSYVDRLTALIEGTWNAVAGASAQGLDLAATQQRVNGDSLSAVFLQGDTTYKRVVRGLFIMPGVEAAYKQLHP